MGQAKQELERQNEENWSSIDDSQVCSKCFLDNEIKNFILASHDGVGCDYCKDSSAFKRKSLNINAVIDHISTSIRKYYEDPAQQMAYDSAEGGYLGNTIDTYDLLEKLIEVEDSDVLEAIQGAFEQTLWCKRNPYSNELSEDLFQDWNSFCEYIKYKKRFFLKDASGIFEDIVHNLKKQELFKIIKPKRVFFRARTFHSSHPFPLQFNEITIPPKEVLAKQANRMSAAGIPLFYCSDTAETCKAEATASNQYGTQHDMISFASFSTKKTLQLLDLSILSEIPSIFGSMEYLERENLIFIEMFRNDIMQPVKRDGCEHVEYIPSQIFTEYLRYNVKNGRKPINGICYPSSKNVNGLNYALFLDSKQVEENNSTSSEAYIYYNSDIISEKIKI